MHDSDKALSDFEAVSSSTCVNYTNLRKSSFNKTMQIIKIFGIPY